MNSNPLTESPSDNHTSEHFYDNTKKMDSYNKPFEMLHLPEHHLPCGMKNTYSSREIKYMTINLSILRQEQMWCIL